MARKKSVRGAADKFIEKSGALDDYFDTVTTAGLSQQETTWAVEAAILKLSVYFEHLMLDALVGAINNDTSTVSASSGIKFPKHLTDKVCEYLVTGGGYFDFRGRDGLIKVLKGYIPDDHYLLEAVRQQRYQVTLERLIALRNLAAHESPKGKLIVKRALGVNRIASAGVWLKSGTRFHDMGERLRELAEEIKAGAPY